jgi:K+-sensing histidine kinase KdpD
MTMGNAAPPTASSSQLPDIPWEDVVRFVRQLSHDLRNHLNAAELQSAYLAEIAADPEIKEEVKRLRGMLAGLGTVLQKLSTDMAHARPSLMSYKAGDFLEDLRRRFEASADKERMPIAWDVQVGDASIDLDAQLLPIAVQELLENAVRYGDGKSLSFNATIDGDRSLVLSLIEPKENFDVNQGSWGREPLRNISQGHYALGLNRARNIVESHGGRLEAHYDQSSKNLITRITIPATSTKS